jgi:hypothetical protein
MASALVLGEAATRNAYLPTVAKPPYTYTSTLYESLEGALITAPVLSLDDTSHAHLWFQVFHEQPILSGLGGHVPGHRPPGFEAWVQNNGLLAAMAAVTTEDPYDDGPPPSLASGTGSNGIVTPADVEALLSAGFRWVVVDPNALHPRVRAAWTQRLNRILAALWQRPTHQFEGAAAWRITSLDRNVRP